VPESLKAAPFQLGDAEAAGVTRSQLRGRRYARPFRGVHLVSDGDAVALPQRCAAALLVVPKTAVFSDSTAAALRALPTPSRGGDIDVTVPPDANAIRRTGIVGHRRDLLDSEITQVHGLPVTTAARTFVDLAGRVEPPDLMAFGDAALRLRMMTAAGVAAVLAGHPGCRGARKAREIVPLLDGRAESPMESHVRWLLLDAGLPRPEVNVNIYDEHGQFIARVDLLFRHARVIVEYDGDHHRTDRTQFAHDLRRTSRLAAAGYRVLRFSAADVLHRPHYVIAAVRAALAA
jgi:very-short-patch-repair endonuclease